MTPDGIQKLRSLLIEHESYRQFPYNDTTGHITIGFGRNLADRGISTTEAISMLDDDIQYFDNKLDSILSFYSGLDDIRKIVLVDMCFNLGVNGFLEFKEMLYFIEKNDWENASKEILASKASEQSPNRYNQLSKIMETGKL